MKPGLFRTAFRSFFIQSAWNFERMQNVGFAFALAPALKRLYPDKERRIRVLRRHMEFFNTHPFMASIVLGSALKMEEDAAAGSGEAALRVSSLKQGLMGPLAAIGDAFFWNTLRPLAALSAAAIVWMVPALPVGVPLAVYLAAFNLPHLFIRFVGIRQGYALGFEVGLFLRKIDMQRIIYSLRNMAMVLLGTAMAGFGLFSSKVSGARMPFGGDFLFIGAGLLMLAGLRLKLAVPWILLLVSLITLLPGLFGQATP